MIIISVVDVYTTDQSFIEKVHLQKPIPLLLTKNTNKGIKEKLIPMKEDTHERLPENGYKYRWKIENKQKQPL